MNSEPQVSVQDLYFKFPDGTEALKGVNLDIHSGEFLAIIGQNGCGKTTLAKNFNGLLRPTGGKVLVEGVNTKEATIAQLARKVGYSFQNPDHQIFSVSIFDEIAFGLRNVSYSESEIPGRVEQALASVRLDHREKDNPLFLSKGERQRVALASILAMSPRVLILDEPTTGQDWKNIVILMDLVQELNQRNNQTVIVITHNMHVVARWTKRVIVMAGGKIILDGTPAEIFAEKEVLEKAFITAPQSTRLSEELGLGEGVLTPQQLIERVLQVNRQARKAS
jgi:energy-coupling factor transporter ATP-binding protein EcfA2